MKNKYFQFEKIDESVTELYIYGDIRKPDIIEKWLDIDDDSRVDAYSFKDALKDVDTPNLLVRINSFGGDVAEGLAIYSLLNDFKGHLITKVDGFACSAASVIFMAGEERIVPESGLIMIHNAWCEACGDKNDLRKAADDLEIITKPSVNIYCKKTGLSEDDVMKMMDSETWMDCKTAFDLGFATSVEKDGEAQQSLGDTGSYIRKLVSKINELKLNQNTEQKNKKIIEKENDWNRFFN